jgi:hypothetical protein
VSYVQIRLEEIRAAEFYAMMILEEERDQWEGKKVPGAGRLKPSHSALPPVKPDNSDNGSLDVASLLPSRDHAIPDTPPWWPRKVSNFPRGTGE